MSGPVQARAGGPLRTGIHRTGLATLRPPAFTAAVLVALAFLATGCGQVAPGPGDPGAGDADPAAVGTAAPLGPTPASLGEAIYLRDCASCHGAYGEGQPNWMITNEDGSLPAPPHDATGHTWHHSDPELKDIVAKGGVIYMANSQMPAYGETLSDDEIVAVLDYIKSLWGPRERSYQAERTMDWERMLASQATPGATVTR